MRSSPSASRFHASRSAFTLPEVLVVTGVIAVLIALLLPALAGAKRTANMTKSMSRLKTIATWMTSYASENREYIVPSQFDYSVSALTYAVKVRSDADLPLAERYRGTWTDILWVYGGMGAKQALLDPSQPTNEDKYVYDSPDRAVYDNTQEEVESPFRSSALNSRDWGGVGAGVPTPFGPGAMESGLRGYFAANNFFNATPNLPANPDTSQPAAGPSGRWYVTGQIKAPDRAMYVVDSVAGETIEPNPATDGPWDNPAFIPSVPGGPITPATDAPNLQVDFRYNGACLMLFLDGHSGPEGIFRDLAELQGAPRRLRILNPLQN